MTIFSKTFYNIVALSLFIGQNVPNTYGTNQPRDYFLSQRENKFSFFSFSRGIVHIDTSRELQQELAFGLSTNKH